MTEDFVDNVVPFQKPKAGAKKGSATSRTVRRAEARSQPDPYAGQTFKAGQNIACIIQKAEVGGYHVTMAESGLSAFLNTQHAHKIGAFVSGVFVCMKNRRALLSELFKAPSRR